MDNIDAYVRYDIYDADTLVEKDESSYLIGGILLNCGNGLSVAPNMRIKSYEDGSDSLTEYKINFQFSF